MNKINNYMWLAVKEAKKYEGLTLSNPLVGCVIVKDDNIIAIGAHKKYGDKHAEIDALNKVIDKNELTGATIYITLEPCTHYGKQPPCINEIIKYKFKKIVIGQLDPNPLVFGKGKQILEERGFKVETINENDDVLNLNYNYNFFYKMNRPFITLKYAMTLDGKIAFNNSRTNITDNDAITDSKNERLKYQSILVGSNTINIDNPFLDSPNNYNINKIVLDFTGKTDFLPTYNIFKNQNSNVFIFTSKKQEKLNDFKNVHIFLKENWSINEVIDKLVNLNIQSVYVEGGSRTHDLFLSNELVDEMIVYVAPKVFGGDALNAIANTFRKVNKYISFDFENISFIGRDIKIVTQKRKWS